MRRFKALAAAVVLSSAVSAQIILPPGFFVSSVTSAVTLGVPGPLGGIEFSASGSTLYVSGNANGGSGAVYALPVIRQPVTNLIIGFGPAVLFGSAPFIDGGLQIGPSGTMFFTTFPTNSLGQIVGGTTTSFPLPSPGSTGGMTFVPAGLPNAGDLIISSYGSPGFYTVGLTPNGVGIYAPTSSTLFATVPSGNEGIRFVPSGPNQGDIIFVNYSLGNVSIMDINPATGQPVGGASNPTIATFASGIGGAEGFAFDPLTNEFFVSTYGANTLLQIGGFPAPQIPLSISASTVPLAGGVRQILMQGGTNAALRDYLVVGGASGTSPGLTVAFLNLPLNIDDFTSLMYPLVNSSLFSNFQGTTDALGSATLTMNIPAIPPVALGVTLSFAGFLSNPINATTTAVSLQIVP